ncbi:hypothetical protein HELRODRAFT_169193 [Helobdella robusta]|uniref:BED-type domain-containing protein n=1 Tax=Helobdella robusta TaxID=6412 RepID=T1F1J9_HELRO|nr:hypothetical protein HELRODRAFT_169193 [Helobdella robusta]ESO08374.1 hypothetical protein HELRODRAFT_169193 [Helobdella robusta]
MAIPRLEKLYQFLTSSWEKCIGEVNAKVLIPTQVYNKISDFDSIYNQGFGAELELERGAIGATIFWSERPDMTSNQNLCQSPIIDSRFLKNDLENIFEFEEKNGQKKSARCKLKNDDVQCNFQAMGTSVSKKFNLWRHVKRNHPKIYDELVKQKDENDKAASDKKRGNENDATPSKKKKKLYKKT